MKFYEASAVIEARPDEVWAVLADGQGMPSWDSGIVRFEGTIGPGEKIKVYSEVSPGRAFPLEVIEYVPGRRMVWRGGMPLGLFTGMRTYGLVEKPSATEFTMREEFTGPLTSLMWRTMPDLGPSFARFANGLKREVETKKRAKETS